MAPAVGLEPQRTLEEWVSNRSTTFGSGTEPPTEDVPRRSRSTISAAGIRYEDLLLTAVAPARFGGLGLVTDKAASVANQSPSSPQGTVDGLLSWLGDHFRAAVAAWAPDENVVGIQHKRPTRDLAITKTPRPLATITTHLEPPRHTTVGGPRAYHEVQPPYVGTRVETTRHKRRGAQQATGSTQIGKAEASRLASHADRHPSSQMPSQRRYV